MLCLLSFPVQPKGVHSGPCADHSSSSTLTMAIHVFMFFIVHRGIVVLDFLVPVKGKHSQTLQTFLCILPFNSFRCLYNVVNNTFSIVSISVSYFSFFRPLKTQKRRFIVIRTSPAWFLPTEQLKNVAVDYIVLKSRHAS